MRRWLLMILIILMAPTVAAPCRAASSEPSPSEVRDDAPVAVPAPTPLALRYYRTGNWLWALNEVWALAVAAGLLFTGASAKIRDGARFLAAPRSAMRKSPGGDEYFGFQPPDVTPRTRFAEARAWFLTVGIYVVLYSIVLYVIDLPLHYYQGFVRQHAYGLSNQTFALWLDHSLKQLAVGATVGFLVAWVPYLLLARRPRSWWIVTTVLTVPFLFAATMLKPIWVDPLFNDFGPMKNLRLEQRILSLAERAGVEGSRIYEVDKSRDTKAVNAYVTGFGETKRVVLWDTLLTKLDEDEVLAVVGHELGHYVLGHVPRSILLSAVITLVSLFWVDRAGRWLIQRFHGRFGFESLSDVASVPLLLMLLLLASLALAPVANAYSRMQEHEADRFALEITRRNRAAALAFVKLQQENLSNPRPGLFYRLWRSTHPSIGDRIDFCNTYRPWMYGQSLRYGQWIHR